MGRDSTPDAPPLAPYRDLQLPPAPANAAPAVIEMWFSFRSPYSWLAMPRVRRLARHYGARLELRYILPMVMRGLPVPPIKSRYIVLDAKREADRCGLPFGRIVDPVGAGAERALAVLHHAVPLGLGGDFAELGLKAAWADGIALAEVAGLRDVARRAGLTDAQVAAALADESWRDAAEANRAALFDAGLWGAPTYRVNGGAGALGPGPALGAGGGHRPRPGRPVRSARHGRVRRGLTPSREAGRTRTLNVLGIDDEARAPGGVRRATRSRQDAHATAASAAPVSQRRTGRDGR